MSKRKLSSGATNLTEGSPAKLLLRFMIPMLIGNMCQQLYNTVDTIIVGRFVGTTALAAVGSTGTIFFLIIGTANGMATGFTVLTSQTYGAGDRRGTGASLANSILLSLLVAAVLTITSLSLLPSLLRAMNTPRDMYQYAYDYISVICMGVVCTLYYNLFSSALRAVGNSRMPLFFLLFSSCLNIILDLLFVIGLHAGIAGVAWATIISQFVSAVMTLVLLSRTKEVFRLVWKDLHINPGMARRIMGIGLPAAAQSVVTAVSNVFVQSYINVFGSAVMAGWSCFNKLDQFIMLVLQSMSMAATAFVSQNIGAGNKKRADRGTVVNVLLTLAVSGVIAAVLFVYADPAVGLFSGDKSVVEAGAAFLRVNVFFTLFNCVNHVLAGGIRGRGDSRGPMVIMLFSFVGVRQVYLYVMAHYISNTPVAVGFGYPVGWMTCCVIEVVYYCLRYSERFRRRHRGLPVPGK